MSQISLEVWPTLQQAAASQQVSIKTLRRRIADGTIKARRFGPRLIRVDPVSLANWGSPLQYIGGDAE